MNRITSVVRTFLAGGPLSAPDLSGRMVRYARVLGYERRLRHVIPSPALASMAASVPENLCRLMEAVRERPKDVRLVMLAHVDERFDRLWETARRVYPAMDRRDAEFLRERFFQGRRPAFRVAATIRSDGEAMAYAIIERDGPVAHLRDLLATSPTQMSVLLTLLWRMLRDERAEVASVRVMAPPIWSSVLTRHGFRPAEVPLAALPGTAQRSLPNHRYLTEADEYP